MRAAPIRADDLSGLPPAMVMTASHDPLFDEGRDYAEKLKAAGVPTDYRNYEGHIHGFWTATGRFDVAAEAQAAACAGAAPGRSGRARSNSVPIALLGGDGLSPAAGPRP